MKPKYFGILFIIFSNFLKLFIPEYTNCTMVNYGSYSGFWYYYRKLQKKYYLDKNIFCYSAGCLAVVANIQHNNIHSINKIVKDLKKKN